MYSQNRLANSNSLSLYFRTIFFKGTYTDAWKISWTRRSHISYDNPVLCSQQRSLVSLFLFVFFQDLSYFLKTKSVRLYYEEEHVALEQRSC